MPEPADSLPQLISEPAKIAQIVGDLRSAGKKVGLVPTMGALHEGHLSLAAKAREQCDVVVAWVFVNPAQFGPDEDFENYPRTLQADLEKLSREKVDYVFAPTAADIYGPNHCTYVDVQQIGKRWEGEFRPIHFRGVATIVLKMFLLIAADVAYFGQKDYQQSRVIKQMVADLNVPIAIEICSTVREADGLAMSSRNVYLSPQQRQQATVLWQCLQKAQELFNAGERSSKVILQTLQQLLADAKVTKIDYIAIADSESLEPLEQLAKRNDSPAVVLLAVYLGETRLIDNVLL